MNLIEQLERATEGSRELDVAITRACYPALIQQHASYYLADIRVDIQPYTTSLDAALTLVPEGWAWNVSSNNVATICRNWDDDSAPVFWSQRPTRRHVAWSEHKGTVATPALALCIAALKAQEKGPGDEVGNPNSEA